MACLLLLAKGLSAEALPLAGLLSRFAAQPQREAHFIEERYAFYLQSPLQTQGYLKATPPDRLEKRIIAPERIEQVISGDRLRHSRDGVLQKEIRLSEQPVLALAINTLRAVLFGDAAYLQQHFQVDYVPHNTTWQLTLRPLSAQIGKHIMSIRVTGDGHDINEFLLTEANGDYTKTRLYAKPQ